MATKSYLGTNHLFTSSGTDDYIEIKSGSDENLRIKTIFNEYVKSNIDSDILGSNQLSAEEVDQHSSAAARSQGTSVSIVNTGTKHYVLSGSPNYPNSGGCAVFDNTGTGAFSEYATLLVNTSGTTEGYYGQYSDINDDATASAFCDFATSTKTLNIYKRSGATWTIYGTVPGREVSVSGKYLLTYDPVNARFRVYLDNLTSYALQQTLLTAANTAPQIDITTDDTIALTNGTSVLIYQRVSTTWTLTQTLAIGVAITALKFSGNLLQYSTSVGIYTYERSAQGSSYALKISKTFSGILDFCCTTVGGTLANNTYLFLGTATLIYVFKRVDDTWVQSTNTTTTSGLTKLNCTGKYLAIGRPTILDKGVVSIYKISDYENGQLIPPNNILDIHGLGVDLTSVYGPVNINNAADFNTTSVDFSVPVNFLTPLGTGTTQKNLLINSSFKVFQRSFRAKSVQIPASTTRYIQDRWNFKNGANQSTYSTSFFDNGQSYVRIQREDGQTGTSVIMLSQTLTSDVTQALKGKKATFSFYARKSAGFASTTLSVQLFTGTATTDMTGINAGFTGNVTVLNDTVTPTTSFARYQKTTSAVIASTITQVACQISWSPVGTASNDYIDVYNCKLEASDFATNYEDQGLSETVRDCEFYYQRFGVVSAFASTALVLRANMSTKFMMNKTPTVSAMNAANTIPNLIATDATANFSQSSFSATVLNGTNDNGSVGSFTEFSNFSGLTVNRSYNIWDISSSNYPQIVLSAEL